MSVRHLGEAEVLLAAVEMAAGAVKARVKAEAKAKAKAKVRVEAKAKAKAKVRVEAEAKAKAEDRAKAKAEAKAKAKAKAKVRAGVRVKAEAKVKAEARARVAWVDPGRRGQAVCVYARRAGIRNRMNGAGPARSGHVRSVGRLWSGPNHEEPQPS